MQADVTSILMPSVTAELLQCCMCICSDSIRNASNACKQRSNVLGLQTQIKSESLERSIRLQRNIDAGNNQCLQAAVMHAFTEATTAQSN